MLILILIDIQYSQKAVSSFEKGSKRQNDLSSGFLHAVKKIASPSKNIRFSPLHWGEFTFLSTTYHDLENPASMEQIFWQLQKSIFLRIFQAFSPQKKSFSWLYHFFIFKETINFYGIS